MIPIASPDPRAFLLLAIGASAVACRPSGEGSGGNGARSAESSLQNVIARIDSAAAAADRIFQPLPLLSFAEETALMRSNAQHLSRARRLGIPRGLPASQLEVLERNGRLVRLETGEHWVIRDLDQSRPLAVPAVRAILTELGQRFQARLVRLGAPRYRMEISSLLRTAADQAALRRANPNAAVGESTHEFGTTFDVLYSAYAAPAEPIVQPDMVETPGLEQFVRRYADVSAERVAGRRALELKAILGKVLIEMQSEGRVLVTIERLQPVYHVTVARVP